MNENEEFEFRARAEAEQAQPPPQYGNNEVLADGTRVPVGSQAAIDARSPVAGQSFLENAQQGIGKLYTGAWRGIQQRYAQVADAISPLPQTMSGLVTGQRPTRLAPLQEEEAESRKVDAPLQSTWGAKAGEVAGLLPLAFLPGANLAGAGGYAAAAGYGAGTGIVQPTVQGESSLLNAGVGGVLGIAGKGVGDKVSSWLTSRAAEPFLGWTPSAGNRVAANAVGVNSLDQSPTGISLAHSQIDQVLNAVRSPDVTAPLGADTAAAITKAASKLNPSTRDAFVGNSEVADLMSHLRNGTATTEQLGAIRSDLGAEASQQMRGLGDRKLGKALFAVQNHVDDVIGSTITDPALAAAYQKVLPQYRLLSTLETRPTLLNSANGEVNMTALGKYLQRTDKKGYAQGGNTSDLYNAARWGQATGEGKGAPQFSIGNFGVPWLTYHGVNNVVSRAIGGGVSRLGAPVAPIIGQTAEGIGFGAAPFAGGGLNSLVSSYLEK